MKWILLVIVACVVGVELVGGPAEVSSLIAQHKQIVTACILSVMMVPVVRKVFN